jgi:penicillin-binding protein 2
MKDSSRYQYRKWIILSFVFFVIIVYFIRLLFLQVFDDQWEIRAKGNALRYVCDYPPRGLIYDRNGEY